MVRQLHLLRHGESERAYGNKDFERNLTSSGRAQLKALGEASVQVIAAVEKVLCSPAVRTRQTAEVFLGNQFAQVEVEYRDELYEAPMTSLLQLITQVDDEVSCLLLIGHNPSVSVLFEHLSGKDYRSLDPGELVTLRFESLAWSEVSEGSGHSD